MFVSAASTAFCFNGPSSKREEERRRRIQKKKKRKKKDEEERKKDGKGRKKKQLSPGRQKRKDQIALNAFMRERVRVREQSKTKFP